MKIVVTIQHPAHVHFFKHAIEELEADGHDVFVFGRENELVRTLLESYDIDHELLAGESGSLLSLAGVQATYEARLLLRTRHIQPDVITAIGGVAASHVAAVVGARSVVFYDTEHATLITALAYPFADRVCTPDCYTGSVVTDHQTYPGFHELAYLHPDRFTPDESVIEDAGLSRSDRLVVCRFSSWDSSHDVGEGGFDEIADVVRCLENVGATVRLTAETDLPQSLEEYRLSVDPERMHDLLYYADLCIGEGATTATESALLGTPAVYVNTLSMGYTSELESEYGLLAHFDGPERHERGLRRAVEWLGTDAETWERRRSDLLSDKVDTTAVIVDQVLTAEG